MWHTIKADVELGLRRYAVPRVKLVEHLWRMRHERRVLVALQARVDECNPPTTLLSYLIASLERDHHRLRFEKGFVGPQAAGLRYMSSVQRSFYYAIWVSVLIASALRLELPATLADDASPLAVKAAGDYAWVRLSLFFPVCIMGERWRWRDGGR